MEQVYGNCAECETHGPLDTQNLCSICGTKNK